MRRLIFIIAIILLSSISHAFDGQRKGLNLGLGFGVCPISKISHYGNGDVGASMDLFGGYSFDNQNTLLWSSKAAASIFSHDRVVIHEIDGLNWYHYIKNCTPSLYSILGLGISSYGNNCWRSEYGCGLVVGLGYEFARHLALNAYVLSGGPEHGDIHMESANFTLNVMIY
jgi:hypothetical protein